MSVAPAGKSFQDGRATATEPSTRLHSLLNRHERPRPTQLQGPAAEKDRVPLRPPKIQKHGSTMALRNMFTRNKTEKESRPTTSSAAKPFAPGATSGAGPKSTIKSGKTAPQTGTSPRNKPLKTAKTEPVKTQDKPVVQPTAKPPSRLNLRMKSVKQNTTPTSKPNATPAPKTPQKPHTTRLSAAWDPPPLFQAYPQAIKYAQLTASTLSADSILRISNHKRNNSIREEIAQTPMSLDGKSAVDAKSKTPKVRRHKRRISASLPRAEWTQKIYVLVTSGYLLQYAGEGSFDRLPEKMMQLGKDSVAFASDVIPGKHWVLQISQAIDANGAPAADSRSLLSRLNFRGADYRRTATSFLLILNSAEEMDSWIAAVRKEIEALGGKKHVSETGKPKFDEKPIQLREQPSHRYLVKRDSARISNPASPQRFSFDSVVWKKDITSAERISGILPDTDELIVAPRPLTSYKPIASDPFSRNSDQIERNLHDNPNRFSYMSSGQPTLFNSQSASITSSPTRASFSTLDEFPTKISVDDVLFGPNSVAINARRKSIQAMHEPAPISSPTQRTRPHSTYSAPIKLMRNRSPSTPNFSFPASSNRRYSSATPTTVYIPPFPSVANTASTTEYVAALREEPENLSTTTSALASPVASPKEKNSHWPTPTLESGPTVLIPTESSFKVVPQAKPSVVTIPARSLSLKIGPTASKVAPPPRRSSVFAAISPAVDVAAQLSPQSPLHQLASLQNMQNHERERRVSSVTPLNQAYEVPAAAMTTPLPASPSVITEPASKLPRPSSVAEKEMIPFSDLSAVRTPRAKPSHRISIPNNQFTSSLLPTPTFSKAPSPQAITTTDPSFSNAKTPTRPSGKPSPQSNTLRPRSSASAITPVTAIPRLTPTKTVTRTPPPKRHISPSLQRLRAEASEKAMGNRRRSMSTLVSGPPPAPPPDCALPPLPPASSGLKSPLREGVKRGVKV
ncbi:hypothetical protein B7463_g139, partial [Scytalidium lignicola]